MMEIFLDIETRKPARPEYDAEIVLGIEYAGTWEEEARRGFAGMGIACVCVEFHDSRGMEVFQFAGIDRLDIGQIVRFNLQRLMGIADRIWTYNGDGFDLPLLRTNGFDVPGSKSCDLKVMIKAALGLGPDDRSKITLDSLAEANKLERKSPNAGAMAPVLWQRGEVQRVLDGCSGDVRILREMVHIARADGGMWVPGGNWVRLNIPGMP